MAQHQIIVFTVNLNYNKAVELMQKTSFSIMSIIFPVLRNCSKRNFTIHNLGNFLIELGSKQEQDYYSDKNCDKSQFTVHINVNDEQIELLKNPIRQQRVLQAIKYCIALVAWGLNDYQVPIDNLDNVLYDQKTKRFYKALGTPDPTLIRLDCEINQTIEEIDWLS